MKTKKLLAAALAALLAANSAIVCAYAEGEETAAPTIAGVHVPTEKSPETMTGDANLLNYVQNLGEYDFDLKGDTVTVKANLSKMKGIDGVASDAGKNVLLIVELDGVKAGDLVIKKGETTISDSSWKTDAHYFGAFENTEEKTYVTLWISLTADRMSGAEKISYEFSNRGKKTTLNVDFVDTSNAAAVNEVTYTSVDTTFPEAFTGDKKTAAELITSHITSAEIVDGEVVITFDKTKEEIQGIIDGSGLLTSGAPSGVDPIYLNITTNIDEEKTAANFVWTSGYGWDDEDHSYNFASGHIKLWLPAIVTDDKHTVKYKVAGGAEQTLTIKYEYGVSPAFNDTDWATGITASADAGVVPEGTELVVKPDAGNATNTEEAIFDITLVNSVGERVQPASGKFVTVKIPVPATMSSIADQLKVFYKDGNNYTNMNATLVDGKLVFNTTHFSTYVVTAKNLAASDPVTPPSTEDPSTPNTPNTSDTPDTPDTPNTPSTPNTSKPNNSGNTGNTSTGNTSTGNTSTGNTSTGNTSTGNTSTGNTGKPGTNPDTGIALAIAPIVLAGAAVAIVSAKKRK